MKQNVKLLLALLILGLLSSCVQTPQDQMSEKVKEKIKNATVHIKNTSGSGGGGSGFFITPNKIVTNIHVIAGKQGISVVGTKTTYHIKEVVGFDPEHDLVILRVKPEGSPLRLGRGEKGDRIFAAGYPAKEEWAYNSKLSKLESKATQNYELTEGRIHDIWNKGRQLRLVQENFRGDFVTTPVSPLSSGNSGGPVVNNKGEVVGIAVTGQDIRSATLVFGGATAATVLEELLQKSESTEPLSISNLEDRPCVRAYGSIDRGQKKMAEATKSETAVQKKRLYSEAIKHFDEASKLCPNYATSWRELGEAKFFLGEFQIAIDCFDKVLGLNVDYAQVYIYRGRAHLELGTSETGVRNVEKARQHYRAAISDFNEALKRIKIDSTYYESLAYAKIRLGELETNQGQARILLEGAIHDLSMAIDLDQEDALYYQNRAGAKILLGELENNQGNRKEAWGLYDMVKEDWAEVIKRDPSIAEFMKHTPESADDYYLRGILNLLLGQSGSNQGNVEEARKHYKIAFKDFPQAAKLNPDDADVYYDKAINTLNPDDSVTYNVRGGLRTFLGKSRADRGYALEARKHYNTAISDFNEAVERNQEDASVYSNRGYTNYLLGKSFEMEGRHGHEEHAQKLYRAALADSNKAIELNSNYSYAYCNRGRAESALEDYDKAIADFGKAIELKKDFAEAYWARGLAYQKTGRLEKAEADFRKAKQLDPDIESAMK